MTTPNITIDGTTYDRFPIKTHLIHIKEDINPLLEKLVVPQAKPGDWIAISEKFVAIAQGRVIHESVVKASWLAKLLVKGVKKHKDDIGYSHPKKMQVAIMQAGYTRMFFAGLLGAVTRLFGRHGDFWRIAGHRVSEIDGFNPDAIPPFNEFAMLGPADPTKTCQEIEDRHHIPAVIIDGNNINVEVLGMSRGVPVTKELARKILLDNPMGQSDELTPIILVREK
ncbi:MAG: F420-0--gamma-glutamyl ligase [Candidatus Andersenbacteria bacterium]